MSDRIKLLSEFVANQIAAGEVVNRPSSVVKEMMENAVDAGAKNITVNYREGGKELIQIIDDGVGMSPIDARLAFDRHATSKINSVDDIYHLGTFGFRGEALASIVSVAEVELRTKQQGQELGTRIEISGGKFVCQNSVNTPVGSQFIVKNLFYNVPARRRFMDKSSTEARHILSEYQRVALCNPGISFSLYDNDALISKLPPSTLRQRVVGVIGKQVAKNLLDVDADTSIVKVEGFVGRPSSARQTNKQQFFFVNGRYFKNPYYHKAVLSAYEKLIAPNTQPSYFIYLTIDPERIDVNVHPQKTEVKFEDGPGIWQILNAAVRESLAKSGAVPAMDFEMDTEIEIPVFKAGLNYTVPAIKGDPDFNPFEKYPEASPRRIHETGASNYSPRNIMPDLQATEEDYERSVLEFIDGDDGVQSRMEMDDPHPGFSNALQVGSRYIAAAAHGSLMVIDIKRAYECILYDRYSTMLNNETSATQQLLFPEKMTLSIDDSQLLKQCLSDFTAFGFDLVLLDENTAEIKGVPADFISVGVEELIYDLLDTLRDQQHDKGEIKRSRVAATMAKIGSAAKSRLMGGEEMKSFLEHFHACGSPAYTPWGTTVMAAFSEDEIASKMKR